MIKLKLKPRHRIVRKVRSAGRIYDTTRDFCSGCRCLYIKKINIPHLVNVLHKLCTTKRTGTGCPVRPLIISVLLLLWTLAACRGLWRGRYVGLYSSLYSSDWTCFCFPGTLSHMNNSKCSKHFFCFTASPLEGKAEFYPVALVSSSADRGDVEEQGGGIRNAESRFRTPLLISASSLFCMNVSCQWTREIKMVVCISRWVAVALLAFSSRAVCCCCCCCF